MALTQRDAARSRSSILDAAEEAFARSGYEGANISEICEAAEVSRGLPSYLFGTKELLYRAVVDRAAERLRERTIEPLRRQSRLSSIEATIELFVDTYVDFLASEPSIVRLLQWEMLRDEHHTGPFAPTSQLFAEVLAIFNDVLKKRSRATIGGPALLASAVALCFFPFMARAKGFSIAGADRGTLRKHKERITRLLLSGIRSS
jgi:AcrR family transcriptional regulator